MSKPEASGDGLRAQLALGTLLKRPSYHNTIVAAIRHFNGAKVLGAAVPILMKYSPGSITESQALKFLNMSILRENIECAVAPDGVARAFIVWGWIDERVINAKVHPPALQLHHFAANEGEHLCLLLCRGEPKAMAELVEKWLAVTADNEEEFYIYPGASGNKSLETFNLPDAGELCRRLLHETECGATASRVKP